MYQEFFLVALVRGKMIPSSFQELYINMYSSYWVLIYVRIPYIFTFMINNEKHPFLFFYLFIHHRQTENVDQ